MFNKPGVFNRNDPITKRDTRPVLGSATTPTPTKNPTAAESENKSGSPVSANTASSAPTTNTPAEAVPTVTEETVIGARLIVGPDVKLKGAEILDCDTLVVEGRVEATMDSRVIRIADKGSFAGKVSIDIAEIHGTFDGELTARTQLTIHATGRVNGKIRYGKLVIDEGGELCGEINALANESAGSTRLRSEPLVALSAAG